MIPSLFASFSPPAWLFKGAVAALLACLNQAPYQARLVGGAVRAAVWGISPQDIDVATTATPEQVTALAVAAGFKVIPTGIDHGTVTVVVEGKPFEVTTLRTDVETYGRKAKVQFGSSFEEDARRRDFTMNALYLDAHGVLHDPLHGFDDLVARRVRFIGHADTRIEEDALRILRFFRFQATVGREIPDQEGLDACCRHRSLLATISAERIHQELMKLLAAKTPLATVHLLLTYGFWHQVVGGIARLHALDTLQQFESTLKMMPDPMLRLAVLRVASCEDGAVLKKRLRLSNKQENFCTALAKALPLLKQEPLPHRAFYLAQDFRTALVAYAAALEGVPSQLETYVGLYHSAGQPLADMPVTAEDLIALGYAPGAELGKALQDLKIWWLQAGCPSDRQGVLFRAETARDVY